MKRPSSWQIEPQDAPSLISGRAPASRSRHPSLSRARSSSTRHGSDSRSTGSMSIQRLRPSKTCSTGRPATDCSLIFIQATC